MPAVTPSVLIVDDAAGVRQAFGRFLTMSGMRPSFAVDGLDGLSHARAERPDAIVCDLDMPEMDGVALCRALRGDASLARVPFVLVTSAAGDRLREAITAGCDAVLPKACSRALLVATIRDLLASGEAPDGD